jgi:LTXXQ motif family protein
MTDDNNSKTTSEAPAKTGVIARMGGKWVVAGLAVITLGAGLAVADWSRGERGHGYGWRGHHGKGPRMERMCERDPLKFEGVARAFLKADLDLTPAQTAELDKLAAQLVPSLKLIRDEMCNNFAAGKDAPAPDRLEKFAAVLKKAAETAEKTVAPARSFYATLDEKQKARVEEMTARRPHHFGKGEMRGQGGPGMGNPGMGR